MIEIKNLSNFKTADSSPDALKNVSLTINDGDIYGIIGGLSGAGKSTLSVRCITCSNADRESKDAVDGSWTQCFPISCKISTDKYRGLDAGEKQK